MTNREALSKQIDALAITDRLRHNLQRIYDCEYSSIRVVLLHDGTVMVGIGHNYFNREKVPLIWKYLKDTGEVDRWRHSFMSKQIEKLDKLRTTIETIQARGNKVLEQLQHGDQSDE